MQHLIPEPFSRDEWVTPDIARTYLEANASNRNLRKDYVTHLANLIRSGDFLPCVQSISFDINGRLIDGQHRLSAIVMADAPAKLTVVRNAPPEAQAVIDTGNRRRNADWLRIKGIKGGTQMASALRLVLYYKKNPNFDFRNDSVTDRRLTALDIERAYHDHQGMDASVAASYKFRIMMLDTSAAFTHYILGKIDAPARDEFFSKLDIPENISADSPIMVLRNALIRHKHDSRRNRTRDKSYEEIGRIFHAWNLWREGKTVKRLTIPAEFPKPV